MPGAMLSENNRPPSCLPAMDELEEDDNGPDDNGKDAIRDMGRITSETVV